MTSDCDENAIFPSCFKTLTVVYSVNALCEDNQSSVIKAPGYHF